MDKDLESGEGGGSWTGLGGGGHFFAPASEIKESENQKIKKGASEVQKLFP